MVIKFIDFETANHKKEIYQIGIYCPEDERLNVNQPLKVKKEEWNDPVSGFSHVKFNFKNNKGRFDRSKFDEYLSKDDLPTFNEFLIDNPSAFAGELFGWNVSTEIVALSNKGITCQIVDVMAIAKEKLKLDSYSLKNVANHYGIEFTWHDAFNDAMATYEIYKRLTSNPPPKENTKPTETIEIKIATNHKLIVGIFNENNKYRCSYSLRTNDNDGICFGYIGQPQEKTFSNKENAYSWAAGLCIDGLIKWMVGSGIWGEDDLEKATQKIKRQLKTVT